MKLKYLAAAQYVVLTLIHTQSLCSQNLTSSVEHAMKFAQRQLERSVADFRDSVQYPRCTLPDGTWRTVRIRDWTSGFFPGCLWYMFEATKDSSFKKAAQRWTEGLKNLQSYGGSHDVGFMVFDSYGNGYRLTKDESYKEVILKTAKTLTTRYNPVVGCIKSWDKRKWAFPVIIDNMMNLELLLWASEHDGTPEMRKMAISHAEKTMQNHFRPNGSIYHVVGYDTTNGAVLVKNTHQGYADETAWARGQAWAIYGFAMVYRFTKDDRFLKTAIHAADYFIAHLPEDHVPYWDFQAPGIPNEPRDASAAAIASSAFFELSGYVLDSNLKIKYLNEAKAILASLCSSAYLAEGSSSRGILNHTVGNKPANSEIDCSLIYGDYYFLEALLRYQKLNFNNR